MQKRIKTLEDQLGQVESTVSITQSTTAYRTPTTPGPSPTSQTSLVVGIPAVIFLMSWLDYRVGSQLAVLPTNQLAWAVWLLVSAVVALWLAIYLRAGWPVAICVATIRSLEKAVVMAYCWAQYDHIHIAVRLKRSDVWTQIFLPELCVFFSAVWLGQWLSNIWLTRGLEENQQGFDRRIRRLNALTTAMAPILVFLASLLAIVIKNGKGD
jgi:hypothetical protein